MSISTSFSSVDDDRKPTLPPNEPGLRGAVGLKPRYRWPPPLTSPEPPSTLASPLGNSARAGPGMLSVWMWSPPALQGAAAAKPLNAVSGVCLLYTSDAADERSSVDLG